MKMIHSMKKIAKDAIRWIAPHLPLGARRALLSGLAVKIEDRYHLLQELASEFDISGFVTPGEYGFIQGSVTDKVIFPLYARRKTWSASTNARFVDFLSNGGTYLDIGANIGLTTIPIARNPQVKCLAFEPDPTNFRLLTTNIAANCQQDNVALYNIALFDRDTVVALERSPYNTGDYRIRRSRDSGELDEASWCTVEVSAKRLDDLNVETRRPLAVKIDTQGAEPFIISGARRILSTAELLAVEFWPYGMARMGGDAQVVIDFLRMNYQRTDRRKR